MSAIATDTAAPHRNANQSAATGSGSHRSTQRMASSTTMSGTSATSEPTTSVETPRADAR